MHESESYIFEESTGTDRKHGPHHGPRPRHHASASGHSHGTRRTSAHRTAAPRASAPHGGVLAPAAAPYPFALNGALKFFRSSSTSGMSAALSP